MGWPYFCIYQNGFPDQARRRKFLRKYLECSKKKSSVTEEDVAILDQETVNFMMASHLMWALWGVIEHCIVDIEFGYIEYAAERLALYSKLKKTITPAISKEEIRNLLGYVHIKAMNGRIQKSSL